MLRSEAITSLAAGILSSTRESGRRVIEKDSPSPLAPKRLSQGRCCMLVGKIQDHPYKHMPDMKNVSPYNWLEQLTTKRGTNYVGTLTPLEETARQSGK